MIYFTIHLRDNKQKNIRKYDLIDSNEIKMMINEFDH